jgi:hypothetical protein
VPVFGDSKTQEIVHRPGNGIPRVQVIHPVFWY